MWVKRNRSRRSYVPHDVSKATRLLRGRADLHSREEPRLGHLSLSVGHQGASENDV